MNIKELNEELRKVESDEQMRILIFRTEQKMRGVFHGKTVNTIIIKNGYARYTYVDSKIKGCCKIEKLHQYVTF
ncbi:hypothetical protein LG291_24840 [Cytobacillus firmus]|uniref:hypothetical protein n=1 Tax=Cytobacillus firmus TaxID=1399 RepID=UPI00384E39FC